MEQLGSGIPRILLYYNKDAFKFSENFVRIILPKGISASLISEDAVSQTDGGQDGITPRQKEVLQLIAANPEISRSQLARKLSINESAIQKHIEALKRKGRIIREGETTGYWKILNNK